MKLEPEDLFNEEKRDGIKDIIDKHNEITSVIHRHENNMYVMSCYLTKEDLYNQMRDDIETLVNNIGK